jgi:dTDP-4-amino-4,6-dideoxygalactose transaminase
MMLAFNKPYLTGKETHYIYDAVYNEGHISGNGKYTKLCHTFFEDRYGFKKCLLTTSCTDALEMAAILCGIGPGDEVIMPSFTFVSTAVAFVRQGGVIRFVDSRKDHPGMDENSIEQLITPKTKAIVVMHYAGVACDMDKIMSIAFKHNLFVIEDAAQAIESSYKGNQLGGLGHLGCFSFHETKNIQCGEGGMLIINDERFLKRAEIIWEKGTNRAEFFRGEVNKYGWVDIGSSFLPSEILAAFLFAQCENIDDIQSKRKRLWNAYYKALKPLSDKGYFSLSLVPDYATNNAHMFYIVCNGLEERTSLISFLKTNNILSVFHYLSLHKSNYYNQKHDERILDKCEIFEDCLLRLPMYYELGESDVINIVRFIEKFYVERTI